jgi:chromosome segregation ATPase
VHSNPHAARSRSAAGRLVALLRRHRRLLTFVGAFIVFATFMLKENFESGLESEMAQMRNARNIFFMRTQMSQISNEIFDIAARLSVVSTDLDEASSGGETWARREATRKSRELKARIGALESVLSNIDVLRASSNEKQLEMGELGRRLKSIQEELDESPSADAAPRQGATDQLAADSAIRDRMQRLSQEVTAVDKSLRELAKASSEFSNETMQRRRQQLEVAQAASIALYVLGWGLGLAARLAGEDFDTDE